MSFITIPPADVDQGSIVDEALMSGKIKNDLDDLDSRLAVIEALSGGGSVAATAAKDLFAKIIAGAEDNIAQYFKVRHHIMMGTTGQGSNTEGADFDNAEIFNNFFFDPKQTINSTIVVDANAYMTNAYYLAQNEQVQFRIKKGENFFWIGYWVNTDKSSIVQVFVDGVNASTFGLVDENGATVASSFTSNGTLSYGNTKKFYGLDGEEHIITIKNANATAQNFALSFCDVGFRSAVYAIDHTVAVKAGSADVGGVGADFLEQSFTFAKPAEGRVNGHTGMIKISQNGTLTAVDGLSPASTETMPNINVAFSSGPVTSLRVKNQFAFPTNGICLLQHPLGETYIFSFNGKSQPGGPQTQTLDNIIWQRQPTEDYKPLVPSAGATYVASEWRNDLRIEYIAKAPIQISGTNNKIDFQITINGVTTSHTATIPSGFYAADIMRIGSAAKAAMSAVKPLTTGEYFWEYNADSQLWTYGVRGASENTEIQFKWNSGANSGVSFKTVIGATSDQTAMTSYLSPTIKQHLAQRVFVQDRVPRSSEHPSIKYNFSLQSNTTIAEADTLQNTAGLPSYRRQALTNAPFWEIFPDDDCCGMTLSFMREDVGTTISYTVDHMNRTYLGLPGRANDTSSPTKGAMIHYFISFPKGSRKIQLRAETGTQYSVEANTNFITFFGYRQWFTKPPWESLTPSEKILKTYEVQPLRLFGTLYAHTAALYVPQVANDNINTLTETGVWTQTTNTPMFNQRSRRTSALNATFEVDFTLQGDGGGIGIMLADDSSASQQVPFYLSNTTIVEANDQIELVNNRTIINNMDDIQCLHLGLKAGTYKLRLKNLHSGALLDQVAIFIVDTVAPQLSSGADITDTHTSLANTNQGLPFPLNVRRRNVGRYGANKQPGNFAEGAFRVGIVNHTAYQTNGHSIETQEDNSLLISQDNAMFWSLTWHSQTTAFYENTAFCRSMAAWYSNFSTFTSLITPSIDGVNAGANITQLECVKGGLSPSSTRYAAVRLFKKNFEYPITYSGSGLTYNMANTQGLRNGQKVLLFDGTNVEVAHVTNIVFNVSFDVKIAPSVVVPASVTRLYFWGFHNMKLTAGNATRHQISAFEYEPLPLEISVLQSRVQTDTFEEIKTTFQVLPTAPAISAQISYQSFEYPMHSDGEQARPSETEIIQVNSSCDANSILDPGLKAFHGSAVTTAVPGRSIITKSRRQVAKLAKPTLLVRG